MERVDDTCSLTVVCCRSETCNVDVINSDSFRLDLTMSGQDCNTQSVVSEEFCHWRQNWSLFTL